MDWSGNLRPPPFVFRPDNSLSFLYNYNHDHFPVVGQPPHGMVGGGVGGGERMIGERMMMQAAAADKKKRLSTEQLEALEISFQEEKQLGPERKMKLARELQLPPRQVAIWFQNRRARWKAKQLEQLYDELKMEYDAVSREREKLQEEVSTLKTMLKDQVMKNPVSKVHTEISNTEETVESTSDGNRSSGKPGPSHRQINDHHNNTPPNNYHIFNLDDYNSAIIPPYWPNVLPNAYP